MPGKLTIDEDMIFEAYNDVRSDKSETGWMKLTYDDEANRIIVGETGTEFDDLAAGLAEDERAYAFARFFTGDELSKRAKFAFITWIGPGVSVLKKAKVSADKAIVKGVVKDFAVEVIIDEKSELSYEKIDSLIRKAGGANYGTGVRN